MDESQEEYSRLLNETTELFRGVMIPLWHLMRAQIHDMATREFGITSSQFHTIRRISQGGASVSALAECMHVSRPNISRSVDELVENGLVSRRRDPDDRRNVHLSLTEKGKNLIIRLHKIYGRTLEKQFSILSVEELHTLTSAFISIKKITDINNQE